MGCASSKSNETALDVYRPAPSSFAVFDINSIEEPWVKLENIINKGGGEFREGEEKGNGKGEKNGEGKIEGDDTSKPCLVPAPILKKLDEEEASEPRTWEEISKALEDEVKKNHSSDLSSDVEKKKTPTTKKGNSSSSSSSSNSSFHTVKELEAKLNPRPNSPSLPLLNNSSDLESESKSKSKSISISNSINNDVPKSVRDNPFIVMDRLQREKEGKESILDNRLLRRRDPLADYPEKCPPGGSSSVVLYTTSLRGVRKTFEDCVRARSVLEIHRVVFDERDVSLHGEYLNELRELLLSEVEEERVLVPRLFIHGRYIGGVDKVVELNESGRLGRILSWVGVERGVAWQGCQGCGGSRFLPCFDCGGSCKLLVGNDKERCPECNENGLVPCPLCH